MSNVSVVDILKIHGNWVESSKFVELISKKLRISERQAYRLIKKDKQILKLVLYDRTVLYGLAEFGLPQFEKPGVKQLSSEQFEYATKQKALRNYLLLIAKLNPQASACKEWADIIDQTLKELDLE